MNRFVSLIVLLAMTAFCGKSELVAVDLIPPGTGTGLKTIYWVNPDISGPSVTVNEPSLDHQWSATDIPAVGLRAGVYSATWCGQIQARSTELYTITTVSDDGVQVALDGKVIINNWTNHAQTRDSAQIALQAGKKYDLRVSYFNGQGPGAIRLLWSSPSISEQVIPVSQLYAAPGAALNAPGVGTGVRAVYWDTQSFSGVSSIVHEPTIDHKWGTAAPTVGIAASTFSVCWTADIEPLSTEKYALTTIADDGIRVEVDGVVIVDGWSNAVAKRSTGYVDFIGGRRYKLRVTYYQESGNALAQLRWSSPTIPEQVIPASQLYPTVPSITQGTGTGFAGTYFPSANFSGAPQKRLDDTVNFTWPTNASPLPGIPAQNFSAHWRAIFTAPFTSSYTFSLASDDGSVLFVNGNKLCGKWGSVPNSGTVYLHAGETCELTTLYYQLGGAATCRLTMSTPEIPPTTIPAQLLVPESLGVASIGSGTGLTGTYFNQEFFAGTKQSRLDVGVSLNLNPSVSPMAGMGKGGFSVVWNGFIKPTAAEPYTFYVMAPDSCSVWFNGALVVDIGGHGPADIRSFTTPPLEIGKQYQIRIAHSNRANSGLMELAWQSPSTSFGVVPQSQLYPGVEEPMSSLSIDGAPLTGKPASFDTAYPGIPETTPINSWTSPAWIEGHRAAGVNPVVALMNKVVHPVCQENETQWYIDGADVGRPAGLPLIPGKECRLLISQAGGSQAVNRLVVPVRWNSINLFHLPYGLENLKIRVGDSLLISGTDVAGETTEIDSQYTNNSFTSRVTAVGPLGAPVSYTSAGFYTIAVRAKGVISPLIKVTVVDLDVRGPTACEVGYTRAKTIQIYPTKLASEISVLAENERQLIISQKTVNSDGSIQLGLHPLVNNATSYQVRLYSGGPLIGKQPIDVFLMKRTSDRVINRIAVYPDGTVLAQEDIDMFPLVKDLQMDLWIFKAGVTFDDSTVKRKLSTTADFLELHGYGRYTFKLLKPPYVNGGLCHAFTIYQNSVQVSY